MLCYRNACDEGCIFLLSVFSVMDILSIAVLLLKSVFRRGRILRTFSISNAFLGSRTLSFRKSAGKIKVIT